MYITLAHMIFNVLTDTRVMDIRVQKSLGAFQILTTKISFVNTISSYDSTSVKKVTTFVIPTNAKCQNTAGGVECTCRIDLESDGTTCADIDECSDEQTNCDDHCDCNNITASSTCSCKDGFTGKGSKCKDINECKKNACEWKLAFLEYGVD